MDRRAILIMIINLNMVCAASLIGLYVPQEQNWSHKLNVRSF